MAGTNFRLQLPARVEKKLRRIPKRMATQMVERIGSLLENPRPRDAKKLKGHHSIYRIRIGDYRVVYEIDEEKQRIAILDLGHRNNIYSLLKQITDQ